MINPATNTRDRMWLEEWLNTVSHAIAAVLSVVAFIFLVFYGMNSTKDWALLSVIFFGISLMAVFISSTLYHAVLTNLKLKRALGIVDHSCIFLLIAGTHTPLLLISIGGDFGWQCFCIEWGLTVIGIFIKIFYKEEFDKYSVYFYLLMASVAGIRVFDLYEALGNWGFALLIMGAISYLIGLIFFLIDKKVPFAHFIWHMMVILGGFLHYFTILLFVI